MSHIHLDDLCDPKIVSRNIVTFCVMRKKTKSSAKNKLSTSYFLVFSTHDTIEMSVFHETWHMHIKRRYRGAKFLFGIF
jgi:hypothetical protein